ncbi:MAG: hypothetical protein K8T25_14605 [Planctomycetia bacterium]|nr:hypothetical protein [Planctomycetia bacterium]
MPNEAGPHELVVLLPCHGLADFPFFHEGEVADDLLASYTAFWHPALVAQARRMPAWRSPYQPSEELRGKLAVLPHVCGTDLPGYWTDEAQGNGALVLATYLGEPRAEIVSRAMALLARETPALSPETVADFYALGLCHLLVELLTVQMRYSSLVDEEHFSRHLVAAAEAAMAKDDSTAHEELAACFDALNQARGHFYPVESYLLDLTLLAPSTLGAALGREVAARVPTSIFASSAVWQQLADRDPALLAAVYEAVADQRISLVGGEMNEQELPLWPLEAALANFQRGISTCEKLLGSRPRVFGRRRAGLAPWLPQLLEQLNFTGAVHFTLDDGRFPQARQSLVRWEGPGGGVLDSLARVPLDAARPESVLSLPQHMGSAMDADHVAIVTFAHWPGKTSIWYQDLLRSVRYAPTLGRFVTVETLLSEAEAPGESSRFTADQYAPPYLAQQTAAGEPNSISRIAELHVRQAGSCTVGVLKTLTSALGGPTVARVGEETAGALAGFATSLPRGKGSPVPGYLVVNPLSFARRVVVPADALATVPAEGAPVYAVGEIRGRREVVVDLPPLGYVWLSGSGRPWAAPAGRVLAESHELRNEFFEVAISPESGGIASIFTPGHRGNRFSQQLALRSPGPQSAPGGRWWNPDDNPLYSKMVAETVEVSVASAATGEIVSRGRLMDDTGKSVARFSQHSRVERGSRVVQLDIELQPLVDLPAEAWQHYFAARFAWPSEGDDLLRDVAMISEITEARRFEAPHFVEIAGAPHRTTILTGGLPYHARSGDRGLDTLLIVRGETAQRFRLGIGLDLTHPQQAALELITPPLILQQTAPPPQPAACWLFHLDAKNVVATHWEPVADEAGRCIGVAVRLLETAGRAVRCGLRSFKQPTSARRLDFTGGTVAELQLDGDKAMIDMAAGEWVFVELEWRR